MSLAGSGVTEGAGGLFVQFNQDCTSLVAGSSVGYHLYALSADDALEEIYASKTGHDVCLVDRLFSSSLVAVVTLAAPRKLIVYHFKKGTEICNYSYSNTILAVKLNRSRLIVCLEESLHIHNLCDMKVLHTIRDTPPNPRGICSVSPSVEHCYLAYPGSSTLGEVQIFDANHLNAKTVIPAHDSPLAALVFNNSGTRIATASERGTVIRVFSVHDRQKLFEFRRGVKRCVNISSLAFSTCGLYLCCSSNTETVHIFKLLDPSKEPGAEEAARAAAAGGWMGWLGAAVTAGATYLPTPVHDVLTQGRAFASARLPVSDVRSALAITYVQKALRLLVATSQGYLYVYSFDTSEGGECTLLRQHRFIDEAVLGAPQATNIEKGVSNSYAGALRGRDPAHMSDSEKYQEMVAATESPPRGGFNFGDDKEFPPMKPVVD